MKYYAFIKDGFVDLILHVESLESVISTVREYQNVIDITDYSPMPEIGWAFDGTDLINPDGETKRITRYAFRRRFTSLEKVSLYSVAATPQGIALRVYLDDVSSVNYVDLSRSDTIENVNYLASLGLLTSERASEILNNPVQDHEKYKGQ